MDNHLQVSQLQTSSRRLRNLSFQLHSNVKILYMNVNETLSHWLHELHYGIMYIFIMMYNLHVHVQVHHATCSGAGEGAGG